MAFHIKSADPKQMLKLSELRVAGKRAAGQQEKPNQEINKNIKLCSLHNTKTK